MATINHHWGKGYTIVFRHRKPFCRVWSCDWNFPLFSFLSQIQNVAAMKGEKLKLSRFRDENVINEPHMWVFLVFKHVSKSPENIHRSLHRENTMKVFKVSFSLQKRVKICFLLKYKGHFFENENFPKMIYAQKVLWSMCYHFINMEFHLNTYWWRFLTFRPKSSNSA